MMPKLIVELLVALLLTCGWSSNALAAGLEKQTLKSKNGTEFSWEQPPGWKTEIQNSSASPIGTVRIATADDISVLYISAIPTPQRSGVETVEDLERLLVTGTKTVTRGSVEKEVHPQSFRSDTAYGVYSLFTDARYVATQPGPGEYRYTATFMLKCGDHIVTATFLSNDEITQSLELATMILKTFRKAG